MSNFWTLLLMILSMSFAVTTAACVALTPGEDGTTKTLEITERPDSPAAAPQGNGVDSSFFELEGTSWTLTSHGDVSALKAVADDADLTADFSTDGQLSGNTGCNRYMTTFEVDENQLTVAPIGLTRMMCVDEALRLQEQQFVEALEGLADGRAFRLTADQLEIDLGNGQLLIFHSK